MLDPTFEAGSAAMGASPDVLEQCESGLAGVGRDVPLVVSCESGTAFFNEFEILLCNIRGFISHRAELDGRLQLVTSAPAMVCLNETFLDDSILDDQLWLSGYKLVSRRDRNDGRSGGGIACFAAVSIAQQVVLNEHSHNCERSWHIIHSDIGPILSGIWYRPPVPGEIVSIVECEAEWRRLSASCVATILVGDMNVHHIRWLRHSSSVSVEGTSLLRMCTACGLRQLVRSPTRDEYLLDLVISDLAASNISVLPKIADHNLVRATFNIGVPACEIVHREVFLYAKAPWEDVRKDIASFDWDPMDAMDVDEAERYFHHNVYNILVKHIPRRRIAERKSKHPWINARCLDAISAKNAASERDDFQVVCARCSEILFEEYLAYVQSMRDKLLGQKRGSKQWWKISNDIMDKQSKCATVPALKTDGGWAHDAESKANVLAKTFAAKWVLPIPDVNHYTFSAPIHVIDSFVPIRIGPVTRALAKVDADSGTGPDGLASRVIKLCAPQLSFAVSKLIRRIVALGFWPTAWIIHWLMPLHKRNSMSDGENYRAINLTSQISKIVERFLSSFFAPQLALRAFGPSQFAYRKLHGARDAVLLYVLSWISALNDGKRIGMYCSDVQGAFDRVDAKVLMRKLQSFGINAKLLAVIESWLRDRSGFVIVGGRKSQRMTLRNMVFQGTVWGSTLWNAFFGDCVCAIHDCDFEVVIYADDCNAFRGFPLCMSNGAILDELHEVQCRLHTWGRANRVIFDAGKEQMMIISTVNPLGGPAKILGVDFDNRLVMGVAVHKCATKASWKCKSLLRVQRFYGIVDMVLLFKAHVLSYIEYRTAGVHFASSSVLREIDEVQDRFVRQIGLTEEDAFMSFNLLPLCVRRDISILGVIHRAALGLGPPQLWQFFRRDLTTPTRESRRARHGLQLVEWPRSRDLDVMRRSALGSIRVYNLLPPVVVAERDVKGFQSSLTNLIRDRVVARDGRWKVVLSPRHAVFQFHPLVS